MVNYLLLSVLPKVGFICIPLAILMVFLLICAADLDSNSEEFKRTNRIILSILLMSVTVWVLIPSKKDILQIKAVNLLTNTKGMDKIPEKLVNKLNELLDIKDDHG